MLLVIGILLALIAACLFVITVWATGMSDAPSGERVALWPSVLLGLLALLVFVLRHHLHGMAITW